MAYKPTIGLEIHAELHTVTKLFCDCLNDPHERQPNVNVCPICLGHPGTLPVLNRRAVELILQIGMALKGDIPQFSKFDRKNYFYPDLPKGYQISQYDQPLVSGGILNGVHLERIHLEEDAGRLVHDAHRSHSLVDFNRAGMALMELVTKPEMHDADTAVAFARELQLILRYLNASEANIEQGQMRVEANVSVSKNDKLGTKVEVKNIASFRAVRGAIEYEIARQSELLDRGEKVSQETRGWDDGGQKTVSQRSKEEAQDYRYFPEPDIPPLDLSKLNLTDIERSIPELPQAKRVRFGREFGLKPELVNQIISDRFGADFFEAVASELGADDRDSDKREIQLAANYLTSDLSGLMMATGVGFIHLKVTPENFADLIELISHDKVSSRSAKDILKKMFETAEDPNVILKEGGLEQVSDEGKLLEVVREILGEHPGSAAEYRSGKVAVLQFFVGKAMAKLRGAGNPQALAQLFERELKT